MRDGSSCAGRAAAVVVAGDAVGTDLAGSQGVQGVRYPSGSRSVAQDCGVSVSNRLILLLPRPCD